MKSAIKWTKFHSKTRCSGAFNWDQHFGLISAHNFSEGIKGISDTIWCDQQNRCARVREAEYLTGRVYCGSNPGPLAVNPWIQKRRGEKTTRNPLVHQQQSSSGGFRCQVTSTLSHPFYLSFPLFEFGALRHLGSPKVVVWPITDLVSFLHFLTFSVSLISGQPIHLFKFNFKWKFSFKNWLLEEGESNTLVACVCSRWLQPQTGGV